MTVAKWWKDNFLRFNAALVFFDAISFGVFAFLCLLFDLKNRRGVNVSLFVVLPLFCNCVYVVVGMMDYVATKISARSLNISLWMYKILLLLSVAILFAPVILWISRRT